MQKYLKKYWFFALLAPLFMIGEVSVDLLQPQLMSTIVDEGVLGLSNGGVGDLHLVISTGTRMILTVVLGGLFGIMCGVFANMASQNFSNDLRKDVFAKVMSLSFSQTDRFSTGSLITRITNDTEAIKADSEAVEKSFYKISEKLYQQAQADAAANGGAAGGDGQDGTYYNADYEDKT